MKITANGITVQYDVEGPVNEPVVTLSHSLAANLHLWDAQAAALRDRYHVLRYDVRGHGGSSVPPGPYTLDQMADDLHGLLQALGIAETHLVGISMGGLIGMTMALRFPRAIRSLVLADTTACYGPERKVGDEDRGTDITMARTMHQRIAGSELSVIPGAAHCSCVEAAGD